MLTLFYVQESDCSSFTSFSNTCTETFYPLEVLNL